ncbi:MAG: hypothetical protein H6629_22295 [Calditrichae bacterium]|nr:hypothetical protein [Calditrichia bacterium]
MTLFNNRFRSEPNRWQWWDYSAPGSYFITVCILDKHPLLGQIIDGEMHLSECGAIVAKQFPLIAEYHPRVRLDEWVIMPDHIHCIITLGIINITTVLPLPGITPVVVIYAQVQPRDIKQYRKCRRMIIRCHRQIKMQTSNRSIC